MILNGKWKLGEPRLKRVLSPPYHSNCRNFDERASVVAGDVAKSLIMRSKSK